MFERFDARSRSVVMHAREEAMTLGATKLEAEHIMLGVSRETRSGAGRVLAEEGLDHDGLVRALDAELVRSLEAVGVPTSTVALAERPLPRAGHLRLGASSRQAFLEALSAAKARGDRTILPAHLLLGILRAREGTVPRALDVAGVDRAALAARVEACLGRPS